MSYTQSPYTIIFLSEPKHARECARFLVERPDVFKQGVLLFALNAEVERALVERSMPFESARTYRTSDAAPMVLGEEWTESVFNNSRWSFFRYRGVSLSRLYFFPLQTYCAFLLYYADIVARVMERYSLAAQYVVFSPGPRPPRGSPVESHQIELLLDVVTLFAKQKGKEVLTPKTTMPMVATRHISFAIQHVLFGLLMAISNASVMLLRRKKQIRILASDYWKNLSPYLQSLDGAEVILLDRAEGLRAGIKNAWKFRMRFLHIDAFSVKDSQERKAAREHVSKEWQMVQSDGNLPAFPFRGFLLRPLLLQVLQSIVTHATDKTFSDIDAAYAMLAYLKPDIVELRSTMSAQTHFVILAQVARALGIPSLEMQHGLEYYGPGSMDKRHSAEHMGVYGPLTQRELRTAEDSITTHVVGSPRFDVYATHNKIDRAKKASSNANISVLCIAPAVVSGIATDTYDVEEYFSTIAAALEGIQNTSVIIKLRPGPSRQSFYEATIARVFNGMSYRIAQFEPLAELYPQADIVVSCYSTAALEALQCGKPLVYLGLSAGYKLMGQYHFTQYAKQGAMALATTKEELTKILSALATDPAARERMSQVATTFLEKEYAFDGHASERAAKLIEDLARNHKPR